MFKKKMEETASMTVEERNRHVKQKLIAAIAMLLISALLVMTSTYAWFTLSTKPEITGISTSVGANGNLEIALLDDTTYGNLDAITSAVGDSTKVPKARNLTWGNLVELGDPSYGTDKFVLNPARLNVKNGKIDLVSMLMTAVYGNDGRVEKLDANTLFGIYSDSAFKSVAGKGYGVRGIGTSSALTENEIAMRNAKAAFALNMNSARSEIQNAIQANGKALADLAMNYALDDTYSATDADTTAVNAIVTAIGNAKANIETALINAVWAYNLTQTPGSELPNELPGTCADASIQAAIDALNGFNPPAAATDPASTKTLVKELIDTDKATILGHKLSEMKNKDTISEIANHVLQNGSVSMELPAGAGPLTKIADFVGAYSASMTLDITYDGMHVENLKTVLNVSGTTPAYITSVGTAVNGFAAKEPDGTESTAEKAITDMYGYAIDFALRTNATNSKLLLQGDSAQRIYGDSTNLNTMGGGSYMEFKSLEPQTFVDDNVKNLMKNIRVVFAEGDGTVKAVAVPDADNAVKDASGSLKAALKLYDFSFTDDGDNGALLVLGEAKATQDIMDLPVNTAVKLTAIVYLDGDAVQNKDVANAMRSMTGSLNLQFATDTALTPMDYTKLK